MGNNEYSQKISRHTNTSFLEMKELVWNCIINDNGDEREIESIIVQEKKSIGSVNVTMCSLLYASKIWKLTERHRRILAATEMDALRKSSSSRTDMIRNEVNYQQVRLLETVITDIERKQFT